MLSLKRSHKAHRKGKICQEWIFIKEILGHKVGIYLLEFVHGQLVFLSRHFPRFQKLMYHRRGKSSQEKPYTFVPVYEDLSKGSIQF